MEDFDLFWYCVLFYCKLNTHQFGQEKFIFNDIFRFSNLFKFFRVFLLILLESLGLNRWHRHEIEHGNGLLCWLCCTIFSTTFFFVWLYLFWLFVAWYYDCLWFRLFNHDRLLLLLGCWRRNYLLLLLCLWFWFTASKTHKTKCRWKYALLFLLFLFFSLDSLIVHLGFRLR